jgi:hypothetical protein
MDDFDRDEFERLLDMTEDQVLSKEEREFVKSMGKKFQDPLWRPTDRQWEKLQELADR